MRPRRHACAVGRRNSNASRPRRRRRSQALLSVRKCSASHWGCGDSGNRALARLLGGWALITVAGGPAEKLRRVIEAFRDGGGEHKPVMAQVKLAWGPDQAAAR